MHIQKPYIHAVIVLCWISWYRPRPFPPTVFSPQIRKISQTYFFEHQGHFTNFHKTLHTAPVDSPDKKDIKIILIFQTILKLLNNFLYIFSKHKVLHISTLVCPNDMKLRWLLPHEPLRLCEKMINLLFLTPPRPFDRSATNFAGSMCGQNFAGSGMVGTDPFTRVSVKVKPALYWPSLLKQSNVKWLAHTYRLTGSVAGTLSLKTKCNPPSLLLFCSWDRI